APEEHRGSSVLAHQGRPRDSRPRPEVFAPVHWTGYRTVRIAEMHLRLSMSLDAALSGETGKRKARALAERGEPDIAGLHRLLRRQMDVAPPVEPRQR